MNPSTTPVAAPAQLPPGYDIAAAVTSLEKVLTASQAANLPLATHQGTHHEARLVAAFLQRQADDIAILRAQVNVASTDPVPDPQPA